MKFQYTDASEGKHLWEYMHVFSNPARNPAALQPFDLCPLPREPSLYRIDDSGQMSDVQLQFPATCICELCLMIHLFDQPLASGVLVTLLICDSPVHTRDPLVQNVDLSLQLLCTNCLFRDQRCESSVQEVLFIPLLLHC